MKVSVIVTVYNVEKYLSSCIQSILDQTYQDFEIILVNDGSTDRSLKICEEFSQKDSRIKIVCQMNQGPGAARNNGISHAQNKWLTFIDGDDFLRPNYLQNLVETVEKEHCDIAIDFHSLFNNNQLFLPYKTVQQFLPQEWIDWGLRYASVAFAVAWGKLYRRQLFENIRYPEHCVAAEDTMTTWKIYLLANSIVVSSQGNYVYRQHHRSLTHSDALKNEFTTNGIKACEEQITVLSLAGLPISDNLKGFYQSDLIKLSDQGDVNAGFKLAMLIKYKGEIVHVL